MKKLWVVASGHMILNLAASFVLKRLILLDLSFALLLLVGGMSIIIPVFLVGTSAVLRANRKMASVPFVLSTLLLILQEIVFSFCLLAMLLGWIVMDGVRLE